MGIDTSLRATGIGVLDFSCRPARVLCGETLRNPPGLTLSQCLCRIGSQLHARIRETAPDAVAVESVFFSRFIRSVLLLGHARGVAILTCAQAGLAVYEYEPRRIKQAVVGYGGASKIQVQRMIQSLLSLTQTPSEDVADALALAFCHHHARHAPVAGPLTPL